MKRSVVISTYLLVLLSSCSTSALQKGIYSNKNGELIKFNSNNTFEFYYYGNNKQIYSSGAYSIKKDTVSIHTDSANILTISEIKVSKEAYTNGKVKIIIDDAGYTKDREGAISYKVFADGMLICDLENSTEQVIGELKSVKSITMSILSTHVKNVYGPAHNSPISTKPFNISFNNLSGMIMTIKINVDPRLFYVTFFNDELVLKNRLLHFQNKAPFFYCPKCKWDKNSMTSPAM